MPATTDRQFISRWATDILGLTLHVAGVPQDADGDVQVALINETTGMTVLQRTTTHPSAGHYETQLSGDETAEPGNYGVRWRYQINGVADEYFTYVTIGQANPAYDQLVPAMKAIVDSVWIRFADLFDAPDGGPNLQTYRESHFTRGRIADLLRVAVGRLNTSAQPFTTYTIDGDGGASFPVAQWGALLEQATYVEMLKHLRRSYVEQPAFQGGAGGARLDRREYWRAWGEVLKDEEKQLKTQLDTFKIGQMGLGKAKALVSGGVYGRFGPTRFAGSVAARPRYWARFF